MAQAQPSTPYVVGAMFPMTFTSEDGDSRLVNATILELFLPFTFSQAMLVTFNDEPSAPSPVVLKLFDRRYVKRQPNIPVWDPSIDTSLKAAISQKKHEALPVIPLHGYIAGIETWEKWMFEWHMWKFSGFYHEAELLAYRKLKGSYGKGVPTLYGTVKLRLPEAEEEDHDVLATVDGIVMEYVDGIPLLYMKAGVNISKEDAAWMYQEALKIPQAFLEHGVIHGDLHFRNLLVRKSDKAPFVIDFGHSRCPSGPNWRAEVEAEGDVEAMKALLGCWRTYDEQRLRLEERKLASDASVDDLTELLGGRRLDRHPGQYTFVPSYHLQCNLFSKDVKVLRQENEPKDQAKRPYPDFSPVGSTPTVALCF